MSNPALDALTVQINKAMEDGAPRYVNIPAKVPAGLSKQVHDAITRLNNNYGVGDVVSVKVFMDGRVEFVQRPFGLKDRVRYGRVRGNVVHALGHQRTIN